MRNRGLDTIRDANLAAAKQNVNAKSWLVKANLVASFTNRLKGLQARLEIVLVFGRYLALKYSFPIEEDVTAASVNALSGSSVAKVTPLNHANVGASRDRYLNPAHY